MSSLEELDACSMEEIISLACVQRNWDLLWIVVGVLVGPRQNQVRRPKDRQRQIVTLQWPCPDLGIGKRLLSFGLGLSMI